MKALPSLAIAALLPLTACTAETDRERQIRAPGITALGPAVSCIPTSRIRNTTVHDDYTIDFEMAGDEIYRNTLPNRCFSLGFEQRFAHSSATGQLCDLDTITVLHASGERGATCGLGRFLPIRYNPPLD